MSLLSSAVNLVLRGAPSSKNVFLLTSKYMRDSKNKFFSSKNRSSRSLKGMFKIGVAGVAVGAVVGTGYSIHYMNHPKAHILNEETFISPVTAIPDFVPSKSVSYIEIQFVISVNILVH